MGKHHVLPEESFSLGRSTESLPTCRVWSNQIYQIPINKFSSFFRIKVFLNFFNHTFG